MADEEKPSPAETFNKLLNDQYKGDGIKLASQLFDENFQYRNQIRDLKEKQPKEGATVLSADEAKDYSNYKKLLEEKKLDFKQLKERVEKYPDLEKSNRELANTENVFKLSDIGLDGSKLKRNVLKEQVFDKYPDAVWSFKKEKDADGREAEVAYITLEGKESSFTEFAKEKLADYLPALKVSQEPQQRKQGLTENPPPSGDKATLYDRIREKVTNSAKPETRTIDAAFGRGV